MESALAGLQRDICLVYSDGIIVIGQDIKELGNPGKVFDRLKKTLKT